MKTIIFTGVTVKTKFFNKFFTYVMSKLKQIGLKCISYKGLNESNKQKNIKRGDYPDRHMGADHSEIM